MILIFNAVQKIRYIPVFHFSTIPIVSEANNLIKEDVAMATEAQEQGLQQKAKESIITLNKAAAIHI